MGRGPATWRRAAAGSLAGLLVLALAGTARGQGAVSIVAPEAGRIFDAHDATVSVEAAVGQNGLAGTAPALTYEWQRCPDRPGAEAVSNPCDTPPDGLDQWALTGPRRFTLARTLPRSWFLRGSGDGRWRLRVRNADTGIFSAWRHIVVAEGVALIDDRPTMPEIGEAGDEGATGDEAGDGNLVVLLRPGVTGAPCGLGRYELRWVLVPDLPEDTEGPPPSWTGTQGLPRRAACLVIGETVLETMTDHLPAGTLWLRARHVWTGGRGLWSAWRMFRIAGEDGA